MLGNEDFSSNNTYFLCDKHQEYTEGCGQF